MTINILLRKQASVVSLLKHITIKRKSALSCTRRGPLEPLAFVYRRDQKTDDKKYAWKQARWKKKAQTGINFMVITQWRAGIVLLCFGTCCVPDSTDLVRMKASPAFFTCVRKCVGFDDLKHWDDFKRWWTAGVAETGRRGLSRLWGCCFWVSFGFWYIVERWGHSLCKKYEVIMTCLSIIDGYITMVIAANSLWNESWPNWNKVQIYVCSFAAWLTWRTRAKNTTCNCLVNC